MIKRNLIKETFILPLETTTITAATNDCTSANDIKEENTMKKIVYAEGKEIDITVCKTVRSISRKIHDTKDIIYNTNRHIEKITEAGLNEALRSYLNGSGLVRYDSRLIPSGKFEDIINEYNKFVETKNSAEEDLKELEEELAKYEF